MRIAIIGAGTLGRALAAAAVPAGHDVTVVDAAHDRAIEVAAATGAGAAESVGEAVATAEVIILAVPYAAVDQLVSDWRPHLAGRVVLDATNPLEERLGDMLDAGISGAETLQMRLPGVRVVKALNTIFATRLDAATTDGVRLDAVLAGDDAEAKSTVADLLLSLGFRPLDAGGLRMARALEEMALLNVALDTQYGWARTTAWTLQGADAA